MSSLDRPMPVFALILALTVALAPALVPGLATSTLAQDQGPSSTGQGDQANDSDRETNRSQDDDRGEEHGPAGEERQEGQADGGSGERGASDDRGPAERGQAAPVEIRDRPGGFATRAPLDTPRPNVAVDARNATASVQRDDVQAMDVHLDTLVAFTDEDGDGAFDVGEPVENRTTLSKIPSHVEADPANDTRTLVYELGGASQLRFVFDLGTDHGENVGTKFDVVIEDYAFADEDTRIALGSRIDVDGGLERVERDGQPAVVGQQGEQVSYLSWVPTVQVDGAEHEVADSVHVDAEQPADSAIVYWAYPQGEKIVHDPELGVMDAVRDLAGQLAPFGLGLAATATLLFGGFAARARWSR